MMGRTPGACHASLTVFFVNFLCISCIDWTDFSTKTGYKFVYDTTTTVQENEAMSITFQGRTCTAVHVNILARHGYRYPGADDMDAYSDIQTRINAHKRSGAASFLDTWVNNYPREEEDELTDTGKEEMRGIGMRFAKRLATLFGGTINRTEFVSSSSQRAKDSAKYFHDGLKQVTTGEGGMNITVIEKDSSIRFYDGCELYEKSLEDNETYMREFINFRDGPYPINATEGMKDRLGLPSNFTFEEDDVELIWELCSFNKNIYGTEDWCDLQTDRDRAIYEYMDDLEGYWEDLYGDPLSARIACPLVKDMFTAMDGAITSLDQGQSYSKGIFQFGHSGTLRPLYAAMGLFKDPIPLLATNMAEQENRKFVTGKVCPMGANIALILYSCQGNQTRPQTDYAIKLMVNEKEESFPACGGAVCWYDDVRSSYRSSIEACDPSANCDLVEQTTKRDPSLASSVTLPICNIILAFLLAVGIVVP